MKQSKESFRSIFLGLLKAIAYSASVALAVIAASGLLKQSTAAPRSLEKPAFECFSPIDSQLTQWVQNR